MHSDLQLRSAERSDLKSLLELYRQLHPADPILSTKDAEQIFERFQHYSGSAILVGFSGLALVTTCALVVVPNLTRGGAPYAVIENVVTDIEHRRKGYGRAVLKEAIAAAWRLGCYKVTLLTGSKNPATLRFYQDCGFEQSKTGFQVRRS